MGVRLENYLYRSDAGTFSQVNKIIKDGRVKVNGVTQKDNNYKVDAESDFVDIDGKLLTYRRYAYVMMNKPEGYVCAEYDRRFKSVIDKLPDWALRRGMKAANFVDRRMSGLVILTDDIGVVNHYKSNKRRIDLVYHIQTNKAVTINDVETFSSGMKTKFFTGEIATLTKAVSYYKDEFAARVTIKETNYSDIVKMFKTIGIQVLSIELIAIGDIVMPIELEEGSIKELDTQELRSLNIKNPYI